MPNLIIGSRGSKLALWQTNWVKSQIEKFHPGLVVEIEIIKTTGDKLTEASLAQIGGKGVFTKEIEEALLDCRVDLAVHSLKDLPTEEPSGLCIAATPARGDARDALVTRTPGLNLRTLPAGAVVGTSSTRRSAQLRRLRPDIEIRDIRGNVDTRIGRVRDPAGVFDATLLAAAGVDRLGRAADIAQSIDPELILPAPGQGALAVQCRSDDVATRTLLDALDHAPTRLAVEAERAFLAALGGGCSIPVAALAISNQGVLRLRGRVNSPDGAAQVDVEGESPTGDVESARRLGRRVAEQALSRGAAAMIAGGAR